MNAPPPQGIAQQKVLKVLTLWADKNVYEQSAVQVLA
jgi:hypothetical protein